MTEVDSFALVLLTLVLGTLVFLGGVAVDWRGAMQSSSSLALWRFLGRMGLSQESVLTRAGERAARIAEMRCATCSSQAECAERLAAGAQTPVVDCPNAELFASLK
ncbi:MAG TPA: hypothetical protein VI321_00795 [Burkholderiales bacterium]